jgi:hypothetical protein
MIVHLTAQPILPEPTIFLKAVDGGWIGMPFVKVLDFRCYPTGR